MKFKYNLRTYQEIDAIMADDDLSAEDKTLFAVCACYGITEQELDNMNPKKVLKMIDKVKSIFIKDVQFNQPKFIGYYKINYDYRKMTFGQYIELVYFFKTNFIDKAHYIVASMASTVKKVDHPIKAEYFLSCKIEDVIGAALKIKNSFNELNNRYKTLFEGSGELDMMEKWFNENFGWFYSATMVAHHEGISLDKAYSLSVMNALNDLIYLKAKQRYETHLSKK